ncbi:MAG: branched-chain amino acid aminotransferase [Steroidobacteraceae bacterium]
MTAISVERVGHSRLGEVDVATVAFSSVFSDHMFSAECHHGQWTAARIEPYGPIVLEPSISALHYGVSVFEGLKVHRGPTGAPLLFRAEQNARRLQRSAQRLAMTLPPESLFLDGLRELIRVDQSWVPSADAGALYVRPLLFSTDPSIRVKPAEHFRFLILTFPYGSYYSAPVDVVATERYVRAFPGGTGDIKPCGNYAASLIAEQEARSVGSHSVMWLDGREHSYIEECGVMNVFFVIGDEVVTPPLSGTIIPGVTRDSVITLLRAMGIHVREEPIAIQDLLRYRDSGMLKESFGTGTAATVAHLGRIRYRSETIELPPVAQRAVGPAVREQLVAVMTGRAPDPHGWVEAVH